MNRREAIRRTTWGAGIGILTPGILAVLQSCRDSTVNVNWVPQVLSDEQANHLNLLSDTILPATDSPSATDVHVPEFIDLLMKDVLTPDQSQDISGGLLSLKAISQTHKDQSFEKLPTGERTALIAAIDEVAFAKDSTADFDPEFLERYKYIKSLILMAYYTSEEGVKQNLNYLVIPGDFQACIDLPPDGRITVGNHM